jgi:hypothetical protein
MFGEERSLEGLEIRLPHYPGFFGLFSGREGNRYPNFGAETTYDFHVSSIKIECISRDIMHSQFSALLLEENHSLYVFSSFKDPFSIYLKAFVLLNSQIDPAEPLEGKAVYPSTLSTNTSTTIADTCLKRSVSNVNVS